jgi:hypothetical protein
MSNKCFIATFFHEHLLPLYTRVYPTDAYNFKGMQIIMPIIVPTKTLRNIKFAINKNSAPNEWLLEFL